MFFVYNVNSGEILMTPPALPTLMIFSLLMLTWRQPQASLFWLSCETKLLWLLCHVSEPPAICRMDMAITAQNYGTQKRWYWQCGKNTNKPSLNWGWLSIRCVVAMFHDVPLQRYMSIMISGPPQKVHENSPQPLLSEDPPSTTGRLGTKAHDGT